MSIWTNFLRWFQMQMIGVWKTGQEQVWDRHRSLPHDLPRGNADGRQTRNVVITGGNRGIGFDAVKTFLELGYRVIVGCRNPAKCNQDLEKLQSEGNLGEGSFEVYPLDLTSLESVKAFAETIINLEIPVHVLANNAGIMMTPLNRTKEGFESQLGVNHLGHFYLTSLLMPRLKEAGVKADSKARIVNVSSAAHWGGGFMDLDDINWETTPYTPTGAYANSKAAQIMFVKKLDRILGPDSPVTVNCIHPGVVKTGLYEHVSWVTTMMGWMMKTSKEGSDTLVHACLGKDIEGRSGLYLENSQIFTPSEFVRDEGNQDKLWDLSMKMVKLEQFMQ